MVENRENPAGTDESWEFAEPETTADPQPDSAVSAHAAGGRRLPGAIVGKIAMYLGLAAPLLAILGALGANNEILTPFIGFRMFLLALPVALLGLVFALFARIRARGDRNPQARRQALATTLLGVVTVGAVVGLGLPAAGFPLINDITTNVEDPPMFVAALSDPANSERDMSYPADFAAQQKAAYPTLDTVRIAKAPSEAFRLAVETLEALRNTEVIEQDPATGRIEAVTTSRIFHFRDDIVVRVRETRGGSLIDMRSKSRDGKGDMGVNARRIEDFFALLH